MWMLRCLYSSVQAYGSNALLLQIYENRLKLTEQMLYSSTKSVKISAETCWLNIWNPISNHIRRHTHEQLQIQLEKATITRAETFCFILSSHKSRTHTHTQGSSMLFSRMTREGHSHNQSYTHTISCHFICALSAVQEFIMNLIAYVYCSLLCGHTRTYIKFTRGHIHLNANTYVHIQIHSRDGRGPYFRGTSRLEHETHLKKNPVAARIIVWRTRPEAWSGRTPKKICNFLYNIFLNFRIEKMVAVFALTYIATFL